MLPPLERDPERLVLSEGLRSWLDGGLGRTSNDGIKYETKLQKS